MAWTRISRRVDSSDDDTVGYETANNDGGNRNEAVVSVLYNRIDRAHDRIERLERDVNFERHHNDVLSAQLHVSNWAYSRL